MFAQKALNGLADGVLFGNPGQLGDPGARRSLAAIVYSGVVSFILLKLISPGAAAARHRRPTRRPGLDISAHGEEAYLHSDGGGRSSMSMMTEPAPPRRVESLRAGNEVGPAQLPKVRLRKSQESLRRRDSTLGRWRLGTVGDVDA